MVTHHNSSRKCVCICDGIVFVGPKDSERGLDTDGADSGKFQANLGTEILVAQNHSESNHVKHDMEP